MTREEAINILIAVAVCSTEYLYCDEHCPFYHPEGVRVCNEWNDEMAKEAVETISALRQQEPVTNRNGLNEPLTLAELRQMDGEPVWVEFQDGSGGCWGLVHITVFTHIVFANNLFCTVGKPYFGKTWLSYRQKPEEDDKHEP